MAWLSFGIGFDSKTGRFPYVPSLPQRQAARRFLQGKAGSDAILQHERALRDGEEEELAAMA